MTCKDFRDRFHHHLTVARDTALPEDTQLHVTTCPQCESYVQLHLVLQQELRRIPRIQPSQKFVTSLKAIGEHFEEQRLNISWKPDLQHAALLLLPALLPLLVHTLSLPALQGSIDFGVKILGFTVLATTIFKPVILGILHDTSSS